jgi:hypothetical protein
LGKKKKDEVAEHLEVIEAKVIKVKRVYTVPTAHGITLDMHVDLDCGGSTVLTGLTNFNHKWSFQVLKHDIEGYEEKEECSKEK